MTSPSARFRAVALLFFFSGCVGLLYEVVWLRMAIRVFGCTTHATSVVLASYMAGLALGSWWIGSKADRSRSPLRLYGILEMGAAATTLLVPILLGALPPLLRALHVGDDSASPARLIMQGILTFLVLLAPTSLMGATLPVMSAVAARIRGDLGAPIATLYGLNTLGAVVGSLATGLVLLGSIGERATLLSGVALQLAITAAALLLAREATPSTAPEPASRDESGYAPPLPERTRKIVLLAFAASGATALAYEVVWTRVLPSILLTSIYAFSGMLALYLTGIGVGSLLGRRLARRARDPVAAIALLQAALALLTLLGFRALDPIRQSLLGTVTASYAPEFYSTFHLRLLAAAAIIIPPTLLLGITFPLVVRSYVQSGASAAGSVGRLYSMNTLGCIAGSLAAGFLLIPSMGVAGTMAVLATVNAAMAIVLFLSDLKRLRSAGWVAALVVVLVALVPSALGLGDPYAKMAFEGSDPRVRMFFHHEDVAATTTAFGIPGNKQTYRLCVNGEGMTVLVTETKLMTYLPLLISRETKDLLILCFGMGTTFKSAMTHGGLRIDTVELVPDVYRASGNFHADVPALLKRENARPIVNDARNYLTFSDAKYDAITIDPPPPLDAAGVVNFYTKDFHEMCIDHLKPGGVVCLWVQPAPDSEARMVLRTFAEVYPQISVWGGPEFFGFYLIGSREQQTLHTERLESLLASPEVLADLRELDTNVDTREELLSLVLSNRDELLRFTQGAPIITDDLPLTEYPLWRRLFEPSGQGDLDALVYADWLRENRGRGRSGQPKAGSGP